MSLVPHVTLGILSPPAGHASLVPMGVRAARSSRTSLLKALVTKAPSFHPRHPTQARALLSPPLELDDGAKVALKLCQPVAEPSWSLAGQGVAEAKRGFKQTFDVSFWGSSGEAQQDSKRILRKVAWTHP